MLAQLVTSPEFIVLHTGSALVSGGVALVGIRRLPMLVPDDQKRPMRGGLILIGSAAVLANLFF